MLPVQQLQQLAQQLCVRWFALQAVSSVLTLSQLLVLQRHVVAGSCIINNLQVVCLSHEVVVMLSLIPLLPELALQLTHDGRWLTTTDNKNTVRIWDTSSLSSPAKQFVVPHPVEAASYCPLKNRFAAGGDDMWVHLHDADTGAELEVNKGHHGPVHTVR